MKNIKIWLEEQVTEVRFQILQIFYFVFLSIVFFFLYCNLEISEFITIILM